MIRFRILIVLLLTSTFLFSQEKRVLNNLPDLIPFNKNGKFGFCDKNLVIKIPCKYEDAEPFSRDFDLLNSGNSETQVFGEYDFATVKLKNKQYRIDKTGKIVYTFKPEDFEVEKIEAYYENKLNVFKKGNFYGVRMDCTIVVKPEYEEIQCFTQYCNPPFIAKLNGKYGLLDPAGDSNVAFKYNKIMNAKTYFYANLPLIKVQENTSLFYVDYNGKEYK